MENTGNVNLTNVAITDSNIANVLCPQTALAPAETMVCSADYTVTQADVDAGEVVNNASVSGNPPAGLPPVSTPDSVTVDSVGMPGLQFEKRAITADFDMAGDILAYEFDVENTGTITLSNIVITDSLIANVVCPSTTLAPAGTMVCSATYTVTQADVDTGEVINNASADATLPDGTSVPTEDDTATVDAVQTPSLDIVKTALTTDFAAVGDLLDYEIVVTNAGNVTVSSIAVSDPLIPALIVPNDSLGPSRQLYLYG